MDEETEGKIAALILKAEEAQLASRFAEALEVLFQLAAYESEFPRRGVWQGNDDTLRLVKLVFRVIEDEVMPLAGLARKVQFKERMERERQLAAVPDLGRERQQPQRLRVKAAEALARRARADLGRLSSRCMHALKLVMHPDALSTDLDCYVSSFQTEGGCLYHRMHCESGEARAVLVTEAHVAYDLAAALAADLHGAHPYRVTAYRNVSLFYYHHLGKRLEAMRVSREAFKAAIDQIDCICEDSYKQVAPVMQYMHDDMAQWIALDRPLAKPEWDTKEELLSAHK